MANYIRVGGEYVNLDKACHIQLYSCTDDTVIVEVEYEHSVKEIPCAGPEEAARVKLNMAIYNACERLGYGPKHPTEV